MTARVAAGRVRGERPLWKAGLVAVLLSALGNATLYSLCYVTGVIPWSMLSPGRGVSLNPGLVISVSIGGAVAGTLIYAILSRIVNDPVRAFRWSALVILLSSFAAPLSIEKFSIALTIALVLMHVVVAAATVWALTIWKRDLTASASL